MTASASTQPVDEGSIDRSLWRVAWPLIIGASLWNVQIALDRMMLGWYGEGAAGAAMTGAMIFWVPLGLLHATVLYSTTFVAQYLGAGETRRVGSVIWNSLWLALLGGLLFLLLIPILPWLVSLTAHEETLQTQESAYLAWLALGALPYLILSAATSFFAGRGQSVVVMLADLVGVAANLMTGYALIFGHWGLPRMGIAGAGIAMVVGNSAAALFALAMLLRRRYEAEFAILSSWRIDFRLLGRMLYYGVPSGVIVAVDVFIWALFVVFIGRMGTLELTVTTIAFTLNMFAFMPAMGLGQAVGILVGQRQGQGDSDGAARVTWRGLAYAMGLNAVVGMFFLLMPGPLAWLFQDPETTANPEQVVLLVSLLLQFVVIYVLFDTMNIIFSHALRGAGDTIFVSLLGLVISWPLLVLPSWAAWHYKLGMFFAWGAATGFIIVLALAFLWRFLGGKWRSMRVIEGPVLVDLAGQGEPLTAQPVLAEGPVNVLSSSAQRLHEESTEATRP